MGFFDATYWRSNSESAVVFSTAVKELLAAFPAKIVFLEIGLYFILAAPLRQIFNSASANVSYVPTLTRKSHASKCLLTAVGEFFSDGVDVDLAALVPRAQVLTNLPTYPWHYDTCYWHETRFSSDRRFHEFPRYDILGSRVPESSQLESTWRNL